MREDTIAVVFYFAGAIGTLISGYLYTVYRDYKRYEKEVKENGENNLICLDIDDVRSLIKREKR